MERLPRLNLTWCRTAKAGVYSVLISSALTLFVGSAIAQSERLQQADKVHMLQSKDSSNKPFFQIRLSIPEGIPKLKSPVNSIEILEGDHAYKPFYVKLGQETLGVTAAPKNKRFALLLLDVSGSMLEHLASGQSKFDAAKAAAKQFLNGFEPGIDNIAVVPFESRQVVPKVQQAVFATDVQSVRAQIDNLAKPDRKGNTGLYTAIGSALDVLNAKKTEDISRSAMLLVLTDGMNDVHPEKGDDPGLLGGEPGLIKVAGAARSSGFTVVTIGFGDTPLSIDTAALRRIASPEHYWSAENLQNLAQIFRREKEALINQFDVTFATNWNDNRSLMGRDIQFLVRMKADDGRSFESDPIAFSTPETSPPPFDGLLSTDEEEAWIRRPVDSKQKEEVRSLEDVLLSRLIIMAGLSLSLAALWFGLPRMMWPESYLRSVAATYLPPLNNPMGQVRGSLPNVPRPTVARPEGSRPRASSPPPPARVPDPSTTMMESKVTIRPGFAPPPKVGAQKLPPQPRRPLDDTIVTGAQAPADTDPWRIDPPAAPRPKR
jgi:Ca-activated chloride channel family protein